jgi:hypothetical protein
MQPTLTDVIKAATVLETPIKSIEEMFHAMKFFAEGPNAPHYLYTPQMIACINDCVELGKTLAAA